MLRLYVEIYHRPSETRDPNYPKKRLIGDKKSSWLERRKPIFGRVRLRGYTFLGYGLSPCNIPQRLKPESLINFAAGLKDLLHPAVGHSKA